MIPRYKDIVDLLKKGSTLEAQEQIMRLRETCIELQEENQELKEQIKKIESKMLMQNEVVYLKSDYWRVQGEVKEGPFCQ